MEGSKDKILNHMNIINCTCNTPWVYYMYKLLYSYNSELYHCFIFIPFHLLFGGGGQQMYTQVTT